MFRLQKLVIALVDHFVVSLFCGKYETFTQMTFFYFDKLFKLFLTNKFGIFSPNSDINLVQRIILQC